MKVVLYQTIVRPPCLAMAEWAALRLRDKRCYTRQGSVSQWRLRRTKTEPVIHFRWVNRIRFTRQVARRMLHCATTDEFIAALPESFQKVELGSNIIE